MSEKYILTTTVHLGHCKDTFGKGSIIEFFPERNLLIINGRKFDDTRDMDVLKNRSRKKPNSPWIIPYSEELSVETPEPVGRPTKASSDKMKIVQSDEDNHEDIDISHTQISRIHEAEKVASRQEAKDREAGRKMEIVRGDESVEDRIARLKGKNDIDSLSERVSLLKERAKLPVVEDDGTHVGSGSKGASLNAGQHLPSREEAEAKKAEAAAIAASYKAEAERNRKASVVESDQDIPPGLGEIQTPQEAASEAALGPFEGEPSTGAGEASLMAENAALRARLAALEAPKKLGGRPKGSKDTAPRKPKTVKG